MGKYYRNGRVWSGDTFIVNGLRTLVGATAEQIWAGAATTRPSPGGIQLAVVSSSAQDDLLIPAVTDVWDVTVGGAADAMDIARITINGANFDYLVLPGDTTALIAAGLADAVNLGSVESWQITPGGAIDVGDTFRITINAVNYDYTVIGGDLLANVCTGLAAAVNGGPDAHYTAAASATNVLLTAIARGVKPNASASMANDPGLDSTCTAAALVGGIAADTNYTANDVASVVTLTNAISGATADTVASSYAVDGGAASTCVAVHTTTGADAVAGTGVRGVRIDYLNGSGVRASETLSTNGTTPATTTATDIVEILGVSASAVGSTGAAVGVISVTSVGGGTTYEEIEAGDCSVLSAITKVPANQRAWIYQVSIAASTASRVSLCSNANPATGAVVSGAKFVWFTDQAGQQGHNSEFVSPVGPFPEDAKIWVEAVGAAGRVITATIEGYLEPDA